MTTEQWVARPRVKRWRQCLYEAGVEAGHNCGEDDATHFEDLHEYVREAFNKALKDLRLAKVYDCITHASPLFRYEFEEGFFAALCPR